MKQIINHLMQILCMYGLIRPFVSKTFMFLVENILIIFEAKWPKIGQITQFNKFF